MLNDDPPPPGLILLISSLAFPTAARMQLVSPVSFATRPPLPCIQNKKMNIFPVILGFLVRL